MSVANLMTCILLVVTLTCVGCTSEVDRSKVTVIDEITIGMDIKDLVFALEVEPVISYPNYYGAVPGRIVQEGKELSSDTTEYFADFRQVTTHSGYLRVVVSEEDGRVQRYFFVRPTPSKENPSDKTYDPFD